MKAPNLKLTIGTKTDLWNKVMKEVQAKRYAGPFESIPFKDDYIQSPIGLVPKDNGKKTRLIFHLSYPRGTGTSVNARTPAEMSTVAYPSFNEAVKLCITEGRFCKIGKSDFLVSSSVSCTHFQAFSDAVSHIVRYFTHKENVNYLDDFLFAALLKRHCDEQLRIFMDICRRIRFPVSEEKTFWGTTKLSFLGLLIDTATQQIWVPDEKWRRAIEMINFALNKPNRKITLKQLQRLCGFLNFINKCIIPGRAFTRRLYAHGNKLSKPNHHLYVRREMRLDLEMWLLFLEDRTNVARPFFHFDDSYTSETLFFYTDASSSKGCGGVCQQDWYMMDWQDEIIEQEIKLSINYLELYALLVAVDCWIDRFANKRVMIFCDNQSVMHMVNNTTSSCINCMVLIRMLVLLLLKNNVHLTVRYVRSSKNCYADLLSRLKYKEFLQLARSEKRVFHKKPTLVPEYLRDIQDLILTK